MTDHRKSPLALAIRAWPHTTFLPGISLSTCKTVQQMLLSKGYTLQI